MSGPWNNYEDPVPVHGPGLAGFEDKQRKPMRKPPTEPYLKQPGAELAGMPSISATGVKFRIARDAHLTAVGAAEMEGSIRAIWKRLEPLLNPKTKNKVFSLVSIAMVTAWKKGYGADKVV